MKREWVVGIGFFVMLFGCAGADSSLIFTAVLAAVGAVIVLGGLYEKKDCSGSTSNSNSNIEYLELYRNRKRRPRIR